jgi:glycyl-tRNA synthetase alpha chain
MRAGRGRLTYGLERLAMYVQGVENVYDLNFNGLEGDDRITYGDVFLQAEQEYSRHNFEHADTEMLFSSSRMRKPNASAISMPAPAAGASAPPRLAAGL